MKKLLFLLLLIPFLGTSQGTFTAPVGYNTGTPTAAPSGVGTRWRFDLLTGKKYTWLPGSMAWDEDAAGIDQVSGCASPAYTPGYNQSNFAVNSCSTPELYQYYSSAWHCLNCGGGTNISAGSGITITGAAPDITISADDNSPTNELQTLSIAGQDLTLSNGGGTVAIPGGSITWPLLAPDGEASAPSYSFASLSQSGLWMGSKAMTLSSSQIAIEISTGNQSDEGVPGAGISIKGGASVSGDGSTIIITGGESEQVNGGGVNVTAGNGFLQGGNFSLSAGNASGGTGGNFDMLAGASSSGPGGQFNIVAGGGSTTGGNVVITPGAGPTDADAGRVIIATCAGVVFPSLTSAQLSSLVPEAGQTVFCTDATANDSSTGVLKTYNGSTWKNHW